MELIDGLSVVLRHRRADIGRILVRIAAPARGGADQVLDRIDLVLGAEGVLKAVCVVGEHQ